MALYIDIKQQMLYLKNANDILLAQYPISSAKNGLGEQKNSFQTPRGKHEIRVKIGADSPINTVFSGRRPTGEIYTSALSIKHPDRDWILSRILWLSGLELGYNRLGGVDTMQRLIYIHGTADEDKIGKPVSHGCIRMRNSDMIELFDQVAVGEPVYIG